MGSRKRRWGGFLVDNHAQTLYSDKSRIECYINLVRHDNAQATGA
jgi:hypothetical protein